MTLPNPRTPLPTLPPPFCPPDTVPPELAQLRHTWLLHNAPVLIQPTIDITTAHNPFICAFYHFDSTNTTCVLSLVYEGESSWEVGRPTVVNRFGSMCYRTHNYRLYRRTADIDHIAYHHCNLQHEEQQQSPAKLQPPDWEVLHTTDFSGLQSWSKGSKRASFLYFFSLMHHYDLEMRREGWRQWHDHWTLQQQHTQLEQWRSIDLHHTATNAPLHTRLNTPHTIPHTQPPPQPTSHYRPVLYLNTGNHTMSPFSTNPATFTTAACTVHSRYPMYPGDRAVAERFAQLAVAHKWTLFSLLPKWAYGKHRGRMEMDRREWQRMHHSVLLEGAVEVERWARVEGVVEQERNEKMSVADGDGQPLAVVQSMESDAGIEQNAG